MNYLRSLGPQALPALEPRLPQIPALQSRVADFDPVERLSRTATASGKLARLGFSDVAPATIFG